MQLTQRILIPLLLSALFSVAESIEHEGLVRVDNGKYWKISNPNKPKITLANILMDIGDQVSAYEGKRVRIKGERHPDRNFPTFQTIDSIEVLEP